MVRFLERLLRSLTAGTDCFGVALDVSAGRVHVIELRTSVVNAGEQNGHTERTTHRVAFVLRVTELNCQVGHGLGHRLDRHLFVV